MAGEERVVLREARAGAEGLGEHRARRGARRGPPARPSPPGCRRRRRPRGRATARRRATPRAPRPPRGPRRRRAAGARGRCTSWASGAGACQSSIGTMTSAGPRRGRGGVVGAHERARDVLRAHGLVDRYRVLARQAVQAAGEEGLLGELAAVLLADHDHQRRAIDARGGQGGDGVAEPRGGVQQGEGRRAAPERVAGGHPDDRALVQRPARTRGRRAGRRGRRSRSSRGWRRSSSAPACAGRRRWPRAPSARRFPRCLPPPRRARSPRVSPAIARHSNPVR